MAQIEPFRGILYDRTRIEVDRVLAPPYDVIDEAAGAALADRHPENCVRLIRPEGEADARYDGAAERLQSWLAEGVLVRDQRPAIYRYHQSFAAPELGGRRITRRAFIAMVRLSDPGEGVIRPHARTRAASRIDRLRLMRATSAHLSPVFALYSDPSGRSDELLKRIERGTKPCVEATTDDGVAHTLWRVDDAETIGKLGRVLAPLNLYIADGHHRYEAMLAWRDELRERAGGSLGTWSEGEFATMCLANIEEEGTISRPIHRVVHGVADFDAARTLEQLGESFDVIAIRGGAGDADHLRDALRVADGDRPSFAAGRLPAHGEGAPDARPRGELAAARARRRGGGARRRARLAAMSGPRARRRRVTFGSVVRGGCRRGAGPRRGR